MYHPAIVHREGNYTVEHTADFYLLRCNLALRVLIRDHFETGFLVVVFVLIEDPIEVRELPRENVRGQQHSFRAVYSTCLRHGSNQWW